MSCKRSFLKSFFVQSVGGKTNTYLNRSFHSSYVSQQLKTTHLPQFIKNHSSVVSYSKIVTRKSFGVPRDNENLEIILDPIDEPIPTSAHARECRAYCTAHSYDLVSFRKSVVLENAEEVKYKLIRPIGTSSLQLSTVEGSDIFLFSFGSLVSWGSKPEEFQSMTKKLRKYEHNSIESEKSEELSEHFEFTTGKLSGIVNRKRIDGEIEEVIVQDDSVTSRLPISFALAQGVKLSLFETQMGEVMQTSKRMILGLQKKKGVSNLKNIGKDVLLVDSKSIAEELGRIVINRINVFSDASDLLAKSTSLFWERPVQESLWKSIFYHLDIPSRTELLNNQMTTLNDIYTMLVNEYHSNHSSRLEYLIIFLIFIEVVFGFWSHGADMWRFFTSTLGLANRVEKELNKNNAHH